jgi:hypothetical protein
LDKGAAPDAEGTGDETGHGEVVCPGGVGVLAQESTEGLVDLGFDHGVGYGM